MKSLLPVLLLAALCGGCETVVFQAPPVPAQACDAALVGNWLSVGDKPEDAGEVELRIDAGCSLLFVEHDRHGTRGCDPTPLHVGRDGPIAYAWVDARWADRRMSSTGDTVLPNALNKPTEVDRAPVCNTPDKPSRFAAGDIVLMRYRVSGRKLELRNADPKAFAHRIVDDRIKGSVARDEQGGMAVRVVAPVDPKLLRDSSLFPRGEMRFERAPAQ